MVRKLAGAVALSARAQRARLFEPGRTPTGGRIEHQDRQQYFRSAQRWHCATVKLQTGAQTMGGGVGGA